MSSSDPRDALKDVFYGLKGIFQRYDRSARKKAWHAVQTGAGKEEVNKLLDNPSRPINGLPRLLNFKEWLANN